METPSPLPFSALTRSICFSFASQLFRVTSFSSWLCHLNSYRATLGALKLLLCLNSYSIFICYVLYILFTLTLNIIQLDFVQNALNNFVVPFATVADCWCCECFWCCCRKWQTALSDGGTSMCCCWVTRPQPNHSSSSSHRKRWAVKNGQRSSKSAKTAEKWNE